HRRSRTRRLPTSRTHSTPGWRRGVSRSMASANTVLTTGNSTHHNKGATMIYDGFSITSLVDPARNFVVGQWPNILAAAAVLFAATIGIKWAVFFLARVQGADRVRWRGEWRDL